MMKKLLILSLLCLCVCPSYAQKDFWRGLTHWKKPAAFETNIKSAVSRTEAALKLPGSPHIRIANLPNAPLVKLGGTVDNAPAILSARMLPGADSWYIIRPTDNIGAYTGQTFLPKDILENKESFYRGMRLGKLDDVKNLLINGLEISKCHYGKKIYFSPNPATSLWYATMGMEPTFTVLVQVPVTPTVRSCTWETSEIDEIVFRRDVPASFISNVWVFLEVNGKSDWYKVTLENGELVFTPTPGRVFENEEF